MERMEPEGQEEREDVAATRAGKSQLVLFNPYHGHEYCATATVCLASAGVLRMLSWPP